MSDVIALAGWPPEVLAYAFAMYSRSALSIKESIKKITDEGASGFLDLYYFKYGHKSIADNAHIPLGVEGISQIAAFEVEDEQLWDGQERSTRYQRFKAGGGYFIPRSVRGAACESEYCRIADLMLGEYESLSAECFDYLTKAYPKPEGMKDDAYERTLRARAFDVARYWLFSGILTNVGQITSARTLESQISRLAASVYPEVRDLADAIKTACAQKPFSPEGRDEPPVAPTLVKYTSPDRYRIRVREKMQEIAAGLFRDGIPASWTGPQRYVALARPGKLEDEIIATLLYEVSQIRYQSLLSFVAHEVDAKQRIIDSVLEDRGPHDPFPRAFASGYAVQFDVVMDRGGERDLHRHRNCVQIHQALTTARGFDTPELIKHLSHPERYETLMRSVGEAVEALRVQIGVDADYLIPFAYRSGTLYKMHLAEAAYIEELRSGSAGHFSYRDVACKMYDRMAERWPFIKEHVRVTPFGVYDPFKR